MELQSGDNVNNTRQTLKKRVGNLSHNDPNYKSTPIDSNVKKLLSESVSQFLKKLYEKSGIQGNPNRADVIKQLNTILDSMPVTTKNALSDKIAEVHPDSRKQLITKFIDTLLKNTFKNKSPYSQKNSEILTKQVKTMLKAAFSDSGIFDILINKKTDDSFKPANAKQKAPNLPTAKPQQGPAGPSGATERAMSGVPGSSVPAPGGPSLSPAEVTANTKLDEINRETAEFYASYKVFTRMLRLRGSFLNISKAYSALSESFNENKFYSDTPIKMQNDNEEQRKEVSEHVFNALKDSTSDAFKALKTFLQKKGVVATDITNIKDYFHDNQGFPKDATSFLAMLLNPKKDNLTTNNKPVEKILHLRALVFQGFVSIAHKSAAAMFNAVSAKSSGTLIDKLKTINQHITAYNTYVKDQKLVRASIPMKLSFNEATGGFVMFSTFSQEYLLAEADRQAAAIQGEGYNKKSRYLQEIQAGLTSTIGTQSDSSTASYSYFQGLTIDQINYLGTLQLVEGGKSIKEKYFPGGLTGTTKPGTNISRAMIKAISSELGSIVKAVGDKSQKISVLLQDATEKRNIASSTLSKFLDKIYDVYKLTAQF